MRPSRRRPGRPARRCRADRWPGGWDCNHRALRGPANTPQPLFGRRAAGHSLQNWLGQRRSGASTPAVYPIDLDARWRHADGQWRYLPTRRVPRRNAQGALVGHVGVALDLSDRFDQQQRVLALVQRLEMATSAAGVGVWKLQLCDPPPRRCTVAGTCRLFACASANHEARPCRRPRCRAGGTRPTATAMCITRGRRWTATHRPTRNFASSGPMAACAG